MQETFKVPDVSCGHCKSAIEGALQPVEGVDRAVVDIDSRAVSVSFDPDTVGRDEVIRKIEEAGYPVSA